MLLPSAINASISPRRAVDGKLRCVSQTIMCWFGCLNTKGVLDICNKCVYIDSEIAVAIYGFK